MVSTKLKSETRLKKKSINIDFFIRGKKYSASDIEFTSRDGKVNLASPDPSKLLDKLVLRDSLTLERDFEKITVMEIVDFLEEVGYALNYDYNPLLQEACNFTVPFSGLTRPIVEAAYRAIPSFFKKDYILPIVENEIGSQFLDGWVEVPVPEGRAEVRAYGAKALHVIAGNVPLVAALTIIRGALAKSDNIIKLPSNDPLTATAILKTMRDIDRTHPVVKHFSSAYWKGGDRNIERRLINPHYIEKIIAWGGHNSIRHIKSLVGPGIDVITLDPKFSVSIIGEEAFESEEKMELAAFLAAIDSSAFNQEACVTSRAHYVMASPEKAAKYARYLYHFMQKQDPSLSTKPRSFPSDLRDNIDSLRFLEEFYDVIGGEDGEGAVITSLTGDPVDFFPSCKTVNVIPITDYSEAIDGVSIATQTVGIYPESLKKRLMSKLVSRGVQRFVSLGQAVNGMVGVPHDSIEPLRRAVKWIVNEINPVKGEE